jgi:DNA-binding SARP family transcriptional activator
MIMFYLLGPVKVADQPSDSVISRKRVARALLATLLHHANQHVSTDRIADCVWSDPPASAHANLRTQITALRRALSDCSGGLGDRLTTRRGGPGDRAAYQLTAEPDEVDATVFTKLADHGHEQLIRQHPSEAIETLRAALHLWRGPIGEDLPDTPILRAWAAELTERRLTAGDDLAEARLQVADHTGLVATLRRRLAANPANAPPSYSSEPCTPAGTVPLPSVPTRRSAPSSSTTSASNRPATFKSSTLDY